MKKTVILLFLTIPFLGISQTDILKTYQEAKQYIDTYKVDSAYLKFQELKESMPKNDTLYEHVVWYKIMTAGHLEETARAKEDFKTSLKYGLDALDGIKKAKFMFDEEFAKREYFMIKNIIVSQYGLGNFEKGKKWKEKMYAAHKENKLPKGLDTYFNFDFFKIGDKNVWGYEWFEDLPKDRFSKSFTKVVYYVYSTNSDGSDKDQLYRLHVLMFHSSDSKFDYVLTKRLETAKNEVSGTLYQYTYQEDIDFEKLQKDVKDIVSGNMKSIEDYLEEQKKKNESEKKGN